MAKLTADEQAVLQGVHDLQLVGRSRPPSPKKKRKGRQPKRELSWPCLPPLSYDPVPRPAIVGELYMEGLGPDRVEQILRRLEAIGAITYGIETFLNLGEHVRPDGRVVKIDLGEDRFPLDCKTEQFRGKSCGTYYAVSVDEKVVYRQAVGWPLRLRHRIGKIRMNDMRIEHFEITPKGVDLLDDEALPAPSHGREAHDTPKPHWNKDRRELSYQGQVVKVFRGPAECQVAILATFEDDGWPGKIDDPIPPKRRMDSGQRLRSAIRALNRAQTTIRFSANGTGAALIWRAAKP